ncbi:glycosyltransferase family 2 protein [Streptomyces gamaensis]|uniref:Glycosyltransferase family 2 protein n=1 Tax=Streptomyces gamaensis TaxID=1763542 RepID=A0ABW0YUN8_9ACTN
MDRDRRPRVRPGLSVVVPSRGPAARLRATLACLAAAGPGGPGFETLVVDDNPPGSPDGPQLAAVARELGGLLPLRVVPGRCLGRAAARNTGAAAARAPRLVFLDDDVLVGPGFLAAHAAAARPGVFVHGMTRELPTAARFLRQAEGGSPEAVQRARAGLDPAAPAPGAARPARRLVANALERAVEAMDCGTLPDAAPWLGFVGANSSVDRADWERCGGFDEGFGTVWGCEDLELGLRLHASGTVRALAPAALGVHLSHARPGRWEQHAVNLGRFAARHPLPSVRALPALLGPEGSPEAYVRAVRAHEAAAPAPLPGRAAALGEVPR